MEKIHKGPNISLPKFSSEVTIVVPFHGQYQRVTRLVESIYRCTRSNPYQILLVDDCSPNRDYLINSPISNTPVQVNRLEVLRTPEQLGFGGAIFHGFKHIKTAWMVVLQSDCELEDLGWLQNLGVSLIDLKNQNVRMISPLTNNSCGHDYQEMSKKKYCGLEHRKDYILDIKQNEYLSLYCFMCHRDLFQRCGGFLRDYPYGWYEDMEFAYRMNKHGYKQAVCHSSWVYHEGEQTIREVWRKNPSSRQKMQENYDRCINDIRKLN